MQPFGLGAHVVEQRVAGDRVLDAMGTRQDLADPEDRGDRRAQLVADHIDERLAELGGGTLIGQELVALLLGPSPFGDVLPGPEHAHGRAIRIAEDAGCAVRPVDAAVRPHVPEFEAERRRPLHRGRDRLAEALAIVGMDAFEVGIEGRRSPAGVQAVLPEDRFGPAQLAGLHVPLPEAGLGCRQHQLQPGIARLDRLRQGRRLVERLGQPVEGVGIGPARRGRWR